MVIPPLVGPETMPRSISGRYRGRTGSWELELRLDIDEVDGRRSMNTVSGDFYNVQRGTVSYFGSFIADSKTLGNVSTDSANVIVEGLGRATGLINFQTLRVTVPFTGQRAPATVEFSGFTGSPENTYLCQFESPYFRTVELEQDYEETVTPFEYYDTGHLPSGGPARSLSVASAFAEAGIEIQLLPSAVNWISSGERKKGIDTRWEDCELHAAMENHLHQWRDEPQWKVWLIAATEHWEGEDLWGVMFDRMGGKMRQGCAVFHKKIGGHADERQRDQLHTYVHEIGHCLNLLHSFEKEFGRPPSPNRPNALSYMNYPQRYLGGPNPSANASAFWAAFPFQFEDEEIAHIRHAFRDDIIMGGNNFQEGAALRALQDRIASSKPILDKSGLLLELRNPDKKKDFAYGEPVVVELKLTTTDKTGKKAHGLLHPKNGFVHIAISKPNGHIQMYKPLVQRCINPSSMTLGDDKLPATYDSAYIGYGKDGFYFDQPGLYNIRAEYYALDGYRVTSNILSITVRKPRSYEDKEVANLLTGPEQGTLLYFIGSDSEFLSKGNEALDKILQEHENHFLANYPRFVKGFNQARRFKTISLEKKVKIRKPDLEHSEELLTPVIDSSARDKGLDNITLSTTMLHLAKAQKVAGKKSDAQDTAGHMVDIFKKKKLNPYVMTLIESQAKQI
jgi:hypothetical protein